MSTSYYAILGVPRNATARQIRQRFLTLARERHPDRFHGDEKRAAEVEFQLVTEAFNTLSDTERRRQHDLELSQKAGSTESDENQVSRVYIQRARQELKKGNRVQALKYFEQATQEDPRNPDAWYQLAKGLQDDRRSLPRARMAIAKACELAPMEAKYQVMAGDVFAASGMGAEAEEAYTKALDWGGSNAKIEQKLADLRKQDRGRLFGKK